MENLNIESIKKDATAFSARVWNSESNKNLLLLVCESRLNLAPCTVYGLDRIGLNHLEIISFAACAGKVIHKLPSSDIDFLNELETRLGIVFGHDEKVENNYLRAKVDHYCGAFTAGGFPQFVSAVFTLDSLYSVKGA